MGQPRRRDPAVQMRETLVIARQPAPWFVRIDAIREVMMARGMPAVEAERRLLRIGPGPLLAFALWSFDASWEIGMRTIFWPQQTASRRAEREALVWARPEFAAAWAGQPTRYSRMCESLSESLRREGPAGSVSRQLVA